MCNAAEPVYGLQGSGVEREATRPPLGLVGPDARLLLLRTDAHLLIPWGGSEGVDIVGRIGQFGHGYRIPCQWE